MKKLLKETLFSTRLMAFLFIVFATAMAFGTFIESKYSTETARIWIYNAWWFEVIMLFFVINFIGNMFRYRLLRWEKWPVLVLHLSWILIILGAFVTRYISYEGMMPIREGSSENVFYSDKTYLTVFVDGEIDGQPRRKILENDLIVTAQDIKSNLPWKEDFNGELFTLSYVDFIDGAKEGLVPDEKGKRYLKLVEAGDGQRHEHYLEDGKVSNIHNVLFSLNKEMDGAINIFATDSIYTIKSPYEGRFMRMADQFQGQLAKDSLQALQLRSLYTLAGMQFVIPEPLVKGAYDIVKVPKEQMNEATLDALVLEVSAGGERVQKKVLGGKGTANFTEKFNVGGLDFMISYGSKVRELPFAIKLNDFIAEKYPGTVNAYKSFMSKVTVQDKRPFDYDIYMNHILNHEGYRFFQSSFMPDEKGTILSVNHDQWGTWITYMGYFLLYLGLVGIMFFGKTRFRDLSKALDKVKRQKTKLSCVLLFLTAVLQGVAQQVPQERQNNLPSQKQIDSLITATTVSKEHADKFGALVIQDEGGRMKPLHTFTSELLRRLSGDDTFKEMNSDQVFLSMMINPPLWYNTEFIKVGKWQNDSIRQILGVKKGGDYVKPLDLFDATGMYKLKPYLTEASSTTNPNAFQKDFIKIHERLGLLDMALSGNILKIFPLLNDENNKWISAVEYRGGQYQVQDSLYANFMTNGLPYYVNTLRNAIASGDYSESDKLLEAFKQNQRNHGSEVLLSEEKVTAEIVYNKLDIFNRLYRYYALVSLLLFFVIIFRIFK
ncbi:MAG: cytochrome c biogenesis protein ResB, partial [Bacteroidota bacterium]